MLQNRRRATDSLFGIQSAVGTQIDDQLVQVGALLNTRAFHSVCHTQYRAVTRIQNEPTHSAGFVIFIATTISRNIAPTFARGKANVQLAYVVQVGYHVLGIYDLNVMVALDVG